LSFSRDALGACAAAIGVAEVDVLPYHRAGLAKYGRFDRRPPGLMAAVPAADPSRVAAVVDLLREYGLDVRAGGSR
jgi:hypothetical protein